MTTLFAFLSLLTAIANIALGLFILHRNHGQLLNRLFFLFTLFLFLWGLGEFFLRSVVTIQEGLFWIWFIGLGSVFIPAIFLHFIITFVERPIRPWVVGIIYGSATVFFILRQATPLLISGVEFYSWGFSGVSGPLFPLYAIYYLGFLVTALFLTFPIHKKNTKKRMQALYLDMGIRFSIALGIATQGIPPLLNIRVVELSLISTTILSVFIAYAMFRHKLFFNPLNIPLKSIFDFLPDALFLFDREGKLIFFNTMARDMVGTPRTSNGENFVSDLFDNKTSENITNVLHTGSAFHSLSGTLESNKQQIPINMSCTVYRKAGNIEGTICIAKDGRNTSSLISELSKKAKSLETSKKELEAKVTELEKFQKILVNREIRMRELKKRIRQLEEGK